MQKLCKKIVCISLVCTMLLGSFNTVFALESMANFQKQSGKTKLDIIYSKGNDIVGIVVDAANNSVIIAYYI